MKVRQTREWDVPDLTEALKAAAYESRKPVTQICREAGVSTQYWYQLLKKNRDAVTLQTLSGLCNALGVTVEEVGLDVPYLELPSSKASA
jgi:DNA-binding Xre family transcriptional regulator